MTVHKFEVCTSTNFTLQQARDAVSNWIGNHEETLTPRKVNIREENTNPDGSGTDYYRGMLNFLITEDKQALIDEAVSDIGANCDWYRIRYHECDHDSVEDGCGWNETYTDGSVPTDLYE